MLGYNELLNDTCSYEKYLKVNAYNEKQYDSPFKVKCFISYNLANSMGYQEQNITTNITVFIDNTFEPNIFDKVNGKEIKAIIPVKGLKTPIIGWEIVL